MNTTATVVTMIPADRYYWTGADITVEITVKNWAELEVTYLTKQMAPAQFEARLDDCGLRPAFLEELFDGSENTMERRFRNVVPGSFLLDPNDVRYVPCHCAGGRWRGQHLLWGAPEFDWGGSSMLLTVRA